MRLNRGDRGNRPVRRARLVGCCLVAAVSAVTSACTGTPPSAPPAAGTAPASAPSTATASSSATITTSPYSLTIPKARKSAVSYIWLTSNGHTTTVLLGQVAPNTDYRLRGACIYGIGDVVGYQLLNAGADRAAARQPHILGSGSIDCDGAVHTKTFRLRFRQAIQLQFGRVGDKTKAYLELDRH